MINTGNNNEFQNAFSASFSYYFDNFLILPKDGLMINIS
jgi:hypothetical protein